MSNINKLKLEEKEKSEGLSLKSEKRYIACYSLRHLYSTQNKIICDWIGTKLIEIGCGIGNFLTDLPEAYKIFGLEVTQEGARTTKKRVPFANIIVGDGHKLCIKSETVDTVVMRGVIHHLQNPKEVFDEINRILSPTGRLIIFEGNPKSLYRKFVLGFVDMFGIEHETSQFEHLSRDEIISLLGDGYNINKCDTVNGLFAPLAYNGVGGENLWKILDRISSMFKNCFGWWNLVVCEKK